MLKSAVRSKTYSRPRVFWTLITIKGGITKATARPATTFKQLQQRHTMHVASNSNHIILTQQKQTLVLTFVPPRLWQHRPCEGSYVCFDNTGWSKDYKPFKRFHIKHNPFKTQKKKQVPTQCLVSCQTKAAFCSKRTELVPFYIFTGNKPMNPDVNLQESVHENTFGATWRARWTISLHPLDLSHIFYWSSQETSVKGGGRVGAEGLTWEGDRVFYCQLNQRATVLSPNPQIFAIQLPCNVTFRRTVINNCWYRPF